MLSLALQKNMAVSIRGGEKERVSELMNVNKNFGQSFDFYTGIKQFNAYEIMKENPNSVFKFAHGGSSTRGICKVTYSAI
jgi:hypothetical protein